MGAGKKVPGMVSDSISGFILGQDLGEGGQAKYVDLNRVRLGYNPTTQEYAAIKIFDRKNHDLISVKKEFKIHQVISHPNIIKLLGSTEDADHVYFILEFAVAGELFDKIEPDVGIDEEVAHFYFLQLINAVSHIHSLGICHRDLKPENILLDECGNLKLSDFGLATVFRHKNKTRTLTTPCGTPPYLAPEVREMNYSGDSVDLWSSGIILYVLLVGNTAWAEPTRRDEEFNRYCLSYPKLNYHPWDNFSKSVSEVLLGLLNANPSQRLGISELSELEWFKLPNSFLEDGMCNDPVRLADRLRSKLDTSEDGGESQPISYSQPADIRMSAAEEYYETQRILPEIHPFSQPQFLDPSQSPAVRVQPNSGSFVNIFPSVHITRFFSRHGHLEIIDRIATVFEEYLIPCRKDNSFLLTFTTVDKRKCRLHGEVSVQPISNACLVQFQKRKGDPLEFKRLYKSVLESVKDLVMD